MKLETFELATIIGYKKLPDFSHIASNNNLHYFENNKGETSIIESHKYCFTIQQIVNGKNKLIESININKVHEMTKECF